MTTETSWTDSYYEALSFFYYEPQHLRRNKRKGSKGDTYDKVMERLHKKEVTLNHNLNQFLLLAPKTLRSQLLGHFFGREMSSEFVMHGRGVDADFALKNAVQPDFLFVSDSDVISVEMKVDAKCTIEQVLKYALLGLAVELSQGTEKTHRLGFLGEGAFSNLWNEGFASAEEMRAALDSTDLRDFLDRPKRARFQEHAEQFEHIVKRMTFGFMNYEQLAAFLRADAPPSTDQTPGAEVYRNLIRGIVGELTRRGLAV